MIQLLSPLNIIDLISFLPIHLLPHGLIKLIIHTLFRPNRIVVSTLRQPIQVQFQIQKGSFGRLEIQLIIFPHYPLHIFILEVAHQMGELVLGCGEP